MYIFNAQLNVDADHVPFSDTVHTAVAGGINYWCTVLKFKWRDSETKQDLLPHQVYAIIREHESGQEYTVDSNVVAKGVQKMLDSPEIFYPRTGPSDEKDGARRLALEMLMDSDGLDIDAGDADCIIQLGLFDEVKYR